jgi:hypothetical protein
MAAGDGGVLAGSPQASPGATHIRVTIRAGALPGLTQLVKEAAGQPGFAAGNGEPDDVRSHVLGAPGRIRTCAHGSGGHIRVQR